MVEMNIVCVPVSIKVCINLDLLIFSLNQKMLYGLSCVVNNDPQIVGTMGSK